MLYLAVFLIMLLIVGAMAVGVLMGRKPISGSCGGLSALGMKESCDICGGDDQACEKEQQRQQALKEGRSPDVDAKSSADLAYDVGKNPSKE